MESTIRSIAYNDQSSGKNKCANDISKCTASRIQRCGWPQEFLIEITTGCQWQNANLDNPDPVVYEKNWKEYYNNLKSLYKNKYNQHILKEIERNLGLLICGADYKGRNTWSGTETMIYNMNM